MKRLTVVAYAVNGSGLGHLTRVLAILKWVRRYARLCGVHPEIYVLTSSEACQLVLEEGFAAFKIPSKTSIRLAQIQKEGYLRLARQWVWHSLGLINPDILLVDTFPAGSFGELFHALDSPAARVFVYRAIKEEFAQQESFQAMLPLYDRILIPGEVGAREPELPAGLDGRLCRLGPILLYDLAEMHTRERARARLGIPDDRLGVWITAGGGGDPRASAGLERIVKILRGYPELHLVIGAGPLYRGEPMRGAGITWLQGLHAARDYRGVDLAISSAGFNSFHELLHAGVATAFYAQEKIADEQWRRVEAARVAGAALPLAVDADGLPCPDSLRVAMEELMDEGRRVMLAAAASRYVPRNWAPEAACEVLSTCLPMAKLEEAMELGSAHFYAHLASCRLETELACELLERLAPEGVLDGEERRELLIKLIDSVDMEAEIVVRLYLALAPKLGRPANAEEAEELVTAAIEILSGLALFGDERGALSFIRLLPAEKSSSLSDTATGLREYLERLHARGETLWRGMAILGRHQERPGNERPLSAVLAAASKEF